MEKVKWIGTKRVVLQLDCRNCKDRVIVCSGQGYQDRPGTFKIHHQKEIVSIKQGWFLWHNIKSENDFKKYLN